MNENNNNVDPINTPSGGLGVQAPTSGGWEVCSLDIKVLGTGCPKCRSLEKTVINALAELDVAASVSKVEDIAEIMNYGVMLTPALVINGKVVVKGRVPSIDEIKSLITNK
ncbi:MAG TPA: thioredoxin family protein [Prolixibacteraceae bacterium]|nr:thioredoxin family protein [Prolixibacteraceae bacterium]HPS13049.1 thioredoxin family protein [Prolixibacteraceae bacterium]